MKRGSERVAPAWQEVQRVGRDAIPTYNKCRFFTQSRRRRPAPKGLCRSSPAVYRWAAHSTASCAPLDVDIVADMRIEHVGPLIAALSKEFCADDEKMKDASEHLSSGVVRAIHTLTGTRELPLLPLQPPGR